MQYLNFSWLILFFYLHSWASAPLLFKQESAACERFLEITRVTETEKEINENTSTLENAFGTTEVILLGTTDQGFYLQAGKQLVEINSVSEKKIALIFSIQQELLATGHLSKEKITQLEQAISENNTEEHLHLLVKNRINHRLLPGNFIKMNDPSPYQIATLRSTLFTCLQLLSENRITPLQLVAILLDTTFGMPQSLDVSRTDTQALNTIDNSMSLLRRVTRTWNIEEKWIAYHYR